jgi:hypothetical protein
MGAALSDIAPYATGELREVPQAQWLPPEPALNSDPRATAVAFHLFAKSWLRYLDALRQGLDEEPFQYAADRGDVSYVRSYLSGFLHNMQRARTAEERAAVLEEARAFLGEQEQKFARLKPEPPRPMKVVSEVQRALPGR